jgi:kinesin family member 12
MTFVDLAGSERLKETKSTGDQMMKETGNINKSLFTLGKVIAMLSQPEKKINQKYIPYRDSKLTMLLQDSLGGTSKALMIACISPSNTYAEETLSTMNYASRAMNIKNKPVLQMDAKDQIINTLKKEIQLLKMENEFLQSACAQLNGGQKIQMPPQLLQSNQS